MRPLFNSSRRRIQTAVASVVAILATAYLASPWNEVVNAILLAVSP